MVWACFAAFWPGRLAVIDGIMNSEVYQRTVEENSRKSVHEPNQAMWQTPIQKLNVSDGSGKAKSKKILNKCRKRLANSSKR